MEKAMHDAQQTLFGVAEADVPTAKEIRTPADISARREAIDTTRSVLMQAPAGAGKTNLLTQRYLALLAQVDEPEQVLAITFTRPATAEMRSRILGALQDARRNPSPTAGESSEIPLARIALRHAEAHSWRILEQPHRLDIQTIDSLCMRLAHAQPLLARLGGELQPSDDCAALYAEAARRTTALLGGANHELNSALRTVLLRRDNNLHEVERLLADMLAQRDAWLGVLPLAPGEQVDWASVRDTLEAPFAAENVRVLDALATTLSSMTECTEELLAVARYASANLQADPETPNHLATLLDISTLPGSSLGNKQIWLALACLLLTSEGSWRKSWTKSDGIPGKGSGAGSAEREQWKRRMQELAKSIQLSPRPSFLLQLLCQLRALPPLRYSDDQWHTLLAVFRLLRRAAAELRFVFAEANKVDFIEIAQSAESVLQDEGSLRGMLESDQKQHILIDEFQDTSRAQYRLIAALLREWTEGDGRTVFLVGDPLQSIYGFRQAEVALFHQTRRHGLPCGSSDTPRYHPCHPLTLTHNFRSHQALVSALNERFEPIFQTSSAEDASGFVAAQAWPQIVEEPSLQLHLQIVSSNEDQEGETLVATTAVTQTTRYSEEAASILRILETELPAVAQAQARGAEEYRIAILVSSRPHLAAILPALRAARIPYRGVDLEPLADQPEIIDILSLLHALIHPADRLAWLGIFRAPWCGLLLRDLQTLAGGDDPALQQQSIPELLADRIHLLSPDGQLRAERTWQALRAARSNRYADGNITLSAWLERTWFALGGDGCVDATGRENIDAFLRLLDTTAPSGVDLLRSDFAQRLRRLCAAPDARTNEHFGVQVMTIHKAKGLGFDVVLLPGLDRRRRNQQSELLAMLQRARAGDTLLDELLLAPIGSKDGEKDAAYAWVAKQKVQRERDETARLFYVAATRARTRLHLFATLEENEEQLKKPKDGSLLAAAWAGFEADAQTQYRQILSIPALAASAEQPTPITPATPYTVEQLPLSWARDNSALSISWHKAIYGHKATRGEAGPPYTRTETGSLLARARGTAMHALMERLADLFYRDNTITVRWKATLMRAAVHSLVGNALPTAVAVPLAATLVDVALAVAQDPVGQWLLAPHRDARAESAWQQWDTSGNLRTIRIDRCFRAGHAPGESGDTHLWIIDYKTGTGPDSSADDNARQLWRAEQQAFYSGQLATYAAFLAASSSEDTKANIRCGVYFPELQQLIHWPADSH
jgi:ATP-dependent helicase/nuclease subunit A